MNSQYRQAYKTVIFCRNVRGQSSVNYHSSYAGTAKKVFEENYFVPHGTPKFTR